MKRTLLILLLALAVRPAQAADENERVAGEAGAKLYAIVQSVLSDATATSVLVIRDGVVLLEKAWGLADRKSGAPATLRTTYDVGSLAKQFTAAAILRLEQDGRLSLDDPVRKHFPDLPEERGGVTISHLLHHTSGIARKSPSPLGSAGTPQEVATRILGPDPETPPGERFSYSNHGYCLLAALVQKVSGVPFEKYLKEAVFGPAGMTSTGFCQDPEMDGARCAKRYGGDGGKLEIGSASYYAWGWGFRGCTGVVTDIRDLERWLAALDGIEVLSAASKEKLFQQGKGGYALGWFVATGDSGAVSHSHGGASQGFSAHLARYPETKSAIVVLCARQDLAPKLAGELERALFPSQPPPPDAEVDPEVLQALTGTYEFPRGGSFEISLLDGALRVAGVGQEPFSRVYYGDGFKAPWLKMFRRVNSRAKQIASPLFAREEESLSAGMVGPDALAHALRIAEILTQTYGKHESYEILGSDTGKTGMHTYLRDHCEKGSPGLVLTWGEGQRVSNVGWRRNAHPFPVRLRAISATEFTAESVFGEGKIHLRLTEGGKSLILLEPDGPGSDAILCPRSE